MSRPPRTAACGERYRLSSSPPSTPRRPGTACRTAGPDDRLLLVRIQATLACFSLGEDYSAFLSLEAADADLREARTSSENAVGDAPAIPACLRRSTVTEHFEDSDGEGPGAPSQPAVDEPASEVPPAWLETPKEVSPQEDAPALVRIPVKAKAPAHQPCHTIRFLLGPSGVAHSCVSPRLPHALPGV